jgi:hypothetical protein
VNRDVGAGDLRDLSGLDLECGLVLWLQSWWCETYGVGQGARAVGDGQGGGLSDGDGGRRADGDLGRASAHGGEVRDGGGLVGRGSNRGGGGVGVVRIGVGNGHEGSDGGEGLHFDCWGGGRLFTLVIK